MPLSDLVNKAKRAARVVRDYAALSAESRQRAALFEGVEAFCLFIGYSRSGHSIVAATLDAHPHAVIAHEQGALLYAHARFDRARLFALLLRNTETVGHTAGFSGGTRTGGYTYDVPGQWQGRFERIRVIGDKHGEAATCRLDAKPELLTRLRRTAGVPVRIVHVVRNPFDNVATMARRRAEKRSGAGSPVRPADLEAATDRYLYLSGANARIKARVGDEAVHDVRHERFVEEPAESLRALCVWLGLEPRPDYLEAAAGIVFASPNQSRDRVEWPAPLRARIERHIAATPFLAGYRFDSP